jgi:Galactose oxidase, central domain
MSARESLLSNPAATHPWRAARRASAKIAMLFGIALPGILPPASSLALETAAGHHGTWNKLDTVPSERSFHSTIYDPVRDRMIVFGGWNSSHQRLNDVWILNLSGTPTWTELIPAGTPPSARNGHTAIYDPMRDRMLVFGGHSSGTQVSDVWELTLSGTPTWNALTTASAAPPARAVHTAIYDPVRDRMIVYGGVTNGPPPVYSRFLGDAWALTLSGSPTWSQLASGPSSRCGHSSIYDPVGDRMVMFGGEYVYDEEDKGIIYVFYNDVWTLALSDLSTWSRLTPGGSLPPGRLCHSAIFDALADRMLVFGAYNHDYGSANDLWALNLTGDAVWSEIGSSPAPADRHGHTAIYDPVRHDMVVFGGEGLGSFDDTWTLTLSDTPAWTELNARPLTRHGHSAIYDPVRDGMVVFGGLSGAGRLNDSWTFTLSNPPGWGAVDPIGTPPITREAHTAIYDPPGDRMVVFGGYRSDNLGDVWTLSLSDAMAWEAAIPGGVTVDGRYGHTAIYDAARHRMVVFGGYVDGRGHVNDVLALSLSDPMEWSQVKPVGTPPTGRVNHAAVYDPVRDRMVVIGGMGYLIDVWALTLSETPEWIELVPDGVSPLGRGNHTAVYDPIRDRIVLFAGHDNARLFGDVWALNLSGTTTWEELIPAGTPPMARYNHTAIYDGVRDQMVVFGGAGADKTVWALAWNDDPTPVLVSLVGTRAEPGYVQLIWQVSHELTPTAMVYRSTNIDTWTVVGSVSPNGEGRLVYEDFDVSSGARYGYRLGLHRDGKIEFLGEAWIDVPSTPEFALAGLRPNPASRNLRAAFTLPDGSPARLELLDLAGRRVIVREVGGFGRGTHVLDLGSGHEIASGVYVLRLSTSTRSVTTRAIVVH